jgi:hypothetical protein
MMMLSWRELSLQSTTPGRKPLKIRHSSLTAASTPWLTPAIKQLPSTVPKAADFAEGIVKSVKEARICMEAAQQKMKARADKQRREVVYNPGDMVMLR